MDMDALASAYDVNLRGDAAGAAERARARAERLRKQAADLDGIAGELEKGAGLIPRAFFESAVAVLAAQYVATYGVSPELAREAARLHMGGRSCADFEDLAQKAPEKGAV